MANEIYSVAGAAGTGFISAWAKRRFGGQFTDCAIAGAAGLFGFMAANQMTGTCADVARGAMNGAAAYMAAKVPEMLGVGLTPTSYRTPIPTRRPVPQIQPKSQGVSVVEI